MADKTFDVLLVHDKPDKLERYRQMLNDAGAGWDVETATCGEEAISALFRTYLRRLDVLMPIPAGRQGRPRRPAGRRRPSKNRPAKPGSPSSCSARRNSTTTSSTRPPLLRRGASSAKNPTSIRSSPRQERRRAPPETLERNQMSTNSASCRASSNPPRRLCKPPSSSRRNRHRQSLLAKSTAGQPQGPHLPHHNCAALPETLSKARCSGVEERSRTLKRRKANWNSPTRAPLPRRNRHDAQTQAKLLRAIEAGVRAGGKRRAAQGRRGSFVTNKNPSR